MSGAAAVAVFVDLPSCECLEHKANFANSLFDRKRRKIVLGGIVPKPVTPKQADHAAIHIAPADLDDDRHTLAYPVPTLGGGFAMARIKQDADLLAQRDLCRDSVAQFLAIVEQRTLLVTTAHLSKDYTNSEKRGGGKECVSECTNRC